MSLITEPAPLRPTSTAPVATEIQAELLDRLRSAQREVAAVHVRVLAIAVLIGVGLIEAAMTVADYYLEIAWHWRALALILTLASATVGAVVAWRRWIVPLTLARAAAALERREPAFGQRLRTALDYLDPQQQPAPAAPTLIEALIADTRRVSARVAWSQLIDRRPVYYSLALATVLSGAGLIFLLAVPELRLAAGRTLLLPWEYTTVTFSPMKATIRRGESVEITVEITGRPLASALLRIQPVDAPEAAWSEIELIGPVEEIPASSLPPPERKPEKFSGTVRNLLEQLSSDTRFEVVAGPRRLPPGLIQVLQPLTVEGFTAEIQPPPYLQQQPSRVTEPALTVPEGADVDFQVQLNRPASEAKLQRVRGVSKGEEPAEAAVAELQLSIEGTTLRGQLRDLRQSGRYELTARAADGIELEPLSVRLQVRLDAKPRVRFIEPPEEHEVIPSTEVALAIEADDDVGLHRVGIAVQVGDRPLETLWEQDFAGQTDPIHAAPILALEDYEATPRDSVTYYAFAEDLYFGEPRRVTTPLRYIDIRPYKRSYQMLDNGGS